VPRVWEFGLLPAFCTTWNNKKTALGLQSSGMLDQVIGGYNETTLPYIFTDYIDFSWL
jgi:hypothetical protein